MAERFAIEWGRGAKGAYKTQESLLLFRNNNNKNNSNDNNKNNNNHDDQRPGHNPDTNDADHNDDAHQNNNNNHDHNHEMFPEHFLQYFPALLLWMCSISPQYSAAAFLKTIVTASQMKNILK
jgi:ABC-type Zn2+ transport system substrate-binding protein/surface adhesin